MRNLLGKRTGTGSSSSPQGLRSPGGTFIGRTLSNLRKRLRRSPSRKFAEEEMERKASEAQKLTEEINQTACILFDAKVIDSAGKDRIINSTIGNSTKELVDHYEKIVKMIKMLNMSRSTMHMRALFRLIDEYEASKAKVNESERKTQQETQQGLQVQQQRKSRRTSMANHHRRLSTIGTGTQININSNSNSNLLSNSKPSSFQNISENKMACKEALEHIIDLGNSQILDSVLVERATHLIEQHDEGTILTILKHSNNDGALRTYLQYRRTKTEDKEMKKKRHTQLSSTLNAELQERTSLMNHLTSGRDAARSMLNELDAMMSDDILQTFDESVLSNISTNKNNKWYQEIVVAGKKIAEKKGLSRHGGATKQAARADALQSNSAIDLSDPAIKSFVRIRPQPNNARPCIHRISSTTVKCGADMDKKEESKGKETSSINTVDHIFPENITQTQVFTAVEPMVLCTLSGYNATIFAYGSTGSGKTFTIVGENDDGLIPRSCSRIYEECRSRAMDGYEHVIKIAYLELYREKLVDLLSKPIQTSGGVHENQDNCTVDILETSEGKTKLIYAKDRGSSVPLESLAGPWIECASASDVMALHRRGCKARAVGQTDLNAHSSRSHSILMMNITSEGPTGTTSGILTLVDLAGSENVKQSNVEGSSLSEAQSNNKSLAALGNVLSLLADKKKNQNNSKKDAKKDAKNELFIPYRSNKLTHLLRDTLGGNAHALMITAVRKSFQFLGQTQVSLHFAERARSIQNTIERNVENADLVARTERRNKQRTTLIAQVQKCMQQKLFHQANGPQDVVVTMTEADFGSGSETVGIQAKERASQNGVL